VLVQTNYGGILQMNGIPVGKALGEYYLKDELAQQSADGSIMIVIATDGPLSDRNLSRLAWRGLSGLARTGSAMSNGSGDYSIAFSTAEEVRRKSVGHVLNVTIQEMPNESVSPLFLAAIEATEEAIYNSLCMAETLEGYRGSKIEGLPLEKVRSLIRKI
jgi:D-aminopeptidase